MAEKPRWRPARMTGWFDPSVLAQSAWMLLMANIFGRHSDRRLIEALGTQPQEIFDYSGTPGEFWIDYVSDVGDGWNPTHAVARGIAEPGLHGTRPGQVLVMGGDQIYPYPSRDAYERRLVSPYREAFAATGFRPDVFAIPGNHDWLDSLIAFTRLFCRPKPGFAGCRTQQTRSYFALALPHDWWLLGIDLQLGAEIDEAQQLYFERVALRMNDNARVILCVPEPQWIYEQLYPGYEAYSARTLEFLRDEVIRRPIAVTLAGDLHHYQRFTSKSGEHRVTAGGGGAFLHPTHQPGVTALADGSTEQAVYPQRPTSARIAWRNLLFPFLNPKACGLAGLVYGLSAWFASSRLEATDLDTLGSAFTASLHTAVRDPVCGLWLMLVIASIVFFTDTHSRLYRLIGGSLHAVAHLSASLVLAWLAARFTADGLGMAYGDPLELIIAGLLVVLAGGVIGGWIIGLYLLVSLNVFGRHNTEAFSSLRVQDYKQWLRLRIDATGSLSAWSFAIDRVPRRWRADASGAPWPDDPRATAPRVVDRFSA